MIISVEDKFGNASEWVVEFNNDTYAEDIPFVVDSSAMMKGGVYQ
jgi:hypothetical protein